MDDRGPCDLGQQMAKLGSKSQPTGWEPDADRECIEGVSICLQPAEVSQHLVTAVPWLQSGQIAYDVAKKLKALFNLIDRIQCRDDFPRRSTGSDDYDSCGLRHALFTSRIRAQKFGHGGVPRLYDSIAFENLPHRSGEDTQVQPKTPMIYIPVVERELLVPIKSIPTVDLYPTSDPRLDVVTAHLLGCISGYVFRKPWARTYQTHLPANYVDESRQLVNAGVTEKTAERS